MRDATPIAFLGLGAMGSRMARRLVDARYDVVVWNRSGVPAMLADLPVRAAPSPREAARGAAFVMAMVSDDEASRHVWTDPHDGALESMDANAIAIECSTLTPGWITDLAKRAVARGAGFLEAPVVGSRAQAETGVLVHLVGGTAGDLVRARPVFEAMSTAVHHVGASPAGATLKLVVNTLLATQVAALAELLALASKAGLDPGATLEVLKQLPVTSAAASAAGTGMLSRQYAPSFPVRLVHKDLGYTLTLGARTDAPLPVTTRIRELFQQASERGMADENITAISRLFSPT